MINSNSSSNTNFVLQEERRNSYHDEIRVCKIIILSVVVFLCLIGGLMIGNNYSETSNTNNKSIVISETSTSSFNSDEDPKELSKHHSFHSTIRYLNETMGAGSDDNDKTRNDHPDLCKNATFDAILSYNYDIFVLKGDWYWKLANNDIDPEYPKPISQKWPGLPGNIDTAFTDYDDKYTYFFKGSQYWKFSGEELEDGFPREIAIDFPNVPDNLQASSMGNREIGELYFFKDTSYWIIDTNKQPYEMSIQHSIENWIGIPYYLDAALRSTNNYYITYFFKEDVYFEYSEETNSVVKEGYTASDWFGCSAT